MIMREGLIKQAVTNPQGFCGGQWDYCDLDAFGSLQATGQ
jgi:hypothetical protein